MTTLPPGVTRFPRTGARVGRVFHPVLDPALAGGVALVGFVLWLTGVVAGHTVLVAVLVGLLLIPLTWALPLVVRSIACVAALVVGLAFDTSAGLYDYAAVMFWLVCLFAGLVVLSGLVQRRRVRRRTASAEGAPASGRNPMSGGDAGFMAVWDGADFDYEMVDPDVETVLGAIRSLDGRERTYVSIFRGRRRLDVGGDARAHVVVQQTTNRVVWHTVCDPTVPDPVQDKASHAANLVAVGYGRERVTFNRHWVTTLARAEQAARVWVSTGERDPTLPWWESTANWRAPRPQLFRASGG